jgi:hypothetical protein
VKFWFCGKQVIVLGHKSRSRALLRNFDRLRPDGSTYFEVDRRRIFHKAGDRIPLNALPVPTCNVVRPRPA